MKKRLILQIVTYILFISAGAQEITIENWNKYIKECRNDSIEVCAIECWMPKYNNGKYEEWHLDTIINSCELKNYYRSYYKCRDEIYIWIPRKQPTWEGFIEWLKK